MCTKTAKLVTFAAILALVILSFLHFQPRYATTFVAQAFAPYASNDDPDLRMNDKEESKRGESRRETTRTSGSFESFKSQYAAWRVQRPGTDVPRRVEQPEDITRNYHMHLLNCNGAAIKTDQQLAEKRAKVAETFDPQQIGTFLDNYKNPCWLDSGAPGGRLQNDSDLLKVRHEQERLKCLPYFYIIGQPKCGTTDLHSVLTLHPNITSDTKEPEWWARQSAGLRHSHGVIPIEADNWRDRYKSVNDYTRYFRRTSAIISREVQGGYHPVITVDASPSTLWEMDRWPLYPGNEHSMTPNFTLAHFMKTFTPNVKIIIILRNPTDRIYSHYFHRGGVAGYNATVADFHERIVTAVEMLSTCFRKRSVRECVYDACLNHMKTGTARAPLRAGVYHPFIKDWLEVFPRSQIKILLNEEYAEDRGSVVNDVFDFLDVGPLSSETAKTLESEEVKNTRKRDAGPMWNTTRMILDDFYKPFNHQLAELLEDERFLWDS